MRCVRAAAVLGVVTACSTYGSEAVEANDAGVDAPAPPPSSASDAGDASDAPSDVVPEVEAAADAEAGPPKRVFVTSSVSNGNFGGLVGADAKCSTVAKSAGLPGAYRAWLSDKTTDAISRLPEAAYYNVDLTVLLFPNRAALAGSPASPIHMNEVGVDTFTSYWTGTKLGGTTATGATCNDWSSGSGADSGETGVTKVIDATWTQKASTGCVSLAALLCFEL